MSDELLESLQLFLFFILFFLLQKLNSATLRKLVVTVHVIPICGDGYIFLLLSADECFLPNFSFAFVKILSNNNAIFHCILLMFFNGLCMY